MWCCAWAGGGPTWCWLATPTAARSACLVGPLLTLSQLPRHLAMGLGVYQGVPLFVSRGIGYSGLNMRIGSPAEVTVLTLRSPAAPR